MIGKQTHNTYSPRKKMAIILLMVISAGWIPYRYFTAPPPRFCEEKNRVLTNEEFIIAALENRYKYNLVKIDGSTKTAQDFYRKYPNCCKVGRAPPLIYKTLWGNPYDENQDDREISLFYPINEKELANIINARLTTVSGGHIKYIDKTMSYYKDTIRMTECGGVGDTVREYLNIKDTPFSNNVGK